MKLVSISGLDGSGKSTQIELLKNHLESQGKKVLYFHAIAFSIANNLNGQRSTVNGQRSTKSVTSANWLQIQLRKIALIIDLIRFKSFKKNYEKQGYDFLLSDRYFYDSLINIAYLKAKSQKLKARSYVPRPDFAFYLNTDPGSIMQRDRTPDQGLEYLNQKKELLDQAATIWNLKIIDGNRNKEEIFEEIKSKLT